MPYVFQNPDSSSLLYLAKKVFLNKLKRTTIKPNPMIMVIGIVITGLVN
jgi:hypothetical protein